MLDAEAVAFARREIKKVRDWRDRGRKKKPKSGHVECVLLELDVAERLLELAEAHIRQRGDPEP
jgi:hypothetical protein